MRAPARSGMVMARPQFWTKPWNTVSMPVQRLGDEPKPAVVDGQIQVVGHPGHLILQLGTDPQLAASLRPAGRQRRQPAARCNR